MAAITRNPEHVIQELFPAFGQPRVSRLPIWNESQKMFIANEYVSAAGHRYYQGVHIGDQLVLVVNIGDYYNFTYLDSIALFGYDDTQIKLLQKKDYEKTFYSENLVKTESQRLLELTIAAQYKMSGITPNPTELSNRAQALVDTCFRSLFNVIGPVNMERIVPILDQVKPKEKN